MSEEVLVQVGNSPLEKPSRVSERAREPAGVVGIVLRSEPAIVKKAVAGTHLIVSAHLADGSEVEVIRSYTDGETSIYHSASIPPAGSRTASQAHGKDASSASDLNKNNFPAHPKEEGR